MARERAGGPETHGTEKPKSRRAGKMRPPQIQSESERTLERLIKEKKGANGETWSNEARAAFEEYIRGTHQMNLVLHYMRLLGPEVVASVVARAWKGMSESFRTAFLEACRSRKNDLKTLVSIAEQLLEEKEDGAARTLLSVLTGRLGRVDQPDSLKEAEQFANAGGFHRAARAMRLAFDEAEAIDRSLTALVDAAERLARLDSRRGARRLHDDVPDHNPTTRHLRRSDAAEEVAVLFARVLMDDRADPGEPESAWWLLLPK